MWWLASCLHPWWEGHTDGLSCSHHHDRGPAAKRGSHFFSGTGDWCRFCNPFLGEEGKFRELVNTFRLFLEGELGEIVKREEEAERLREEQLLQERERALAEAAEREALQIEDEEQQTKSPGSAETETPPHSVS